MTRSQAPKGKRFPLKLRIVLGKGGVGEKKGERVRRRLLGPVPKASTIFQGEKYEKRKGEEEGKTRWSRKTSVFSEGVHAVVACARIRGGAEKKKKGGKDRRLAQCRSGWCGARWGGAWEDATRTCMR